MQTPETPTTRYTLSGLDLRKQWIPWQPPTPREPDLPNHKFLGHVRDVDGALWDIRQIRPTKHGFDILFGSPDVGSGIFRGGIPRIIATQPLVDYWETNRTKRDGVLYDLPAGRTTLKRVRRRLGFNWENDTAEFWKQHIEDLASLSPRAFGERYNINPCVVSQARMNLLGRIARELNWWKKSRPLRILRSDRTLRQKGEMLGISTSQVHRLTQRALAAK